VINATTSWSTADPRGAACRVSLSTRQPLREGGWVDGDSLCLRLPGGALERYPASPPGLIGRHNQENALASLLAGRLAGASHEQALARCCVPAPGPPHGAGGESAGVAFFDDSRGPTSGAVVAALTGFPRPVC
jgi:UDP-N-acetylmuramoylalanine-D-glutamate ligase